MNRFKLCSNLRAVFKTILLLKRYRRRGYPSHLINAFKTLYKHAEVILHTNSCLTRRIATNGCVRRGFSILPTVFKIYLDHTMRKWKAQFESEVLIDRLDTILNQLLCSDDVEIFVGSEDYLQRGIYLHGNVCKDCLLSISEIENKNYNIYTISPKKIKNCVNNKNIKKCNEQ